MSFEVIQGDCLGVMAEMAAGSVDAVVTDPPYGSRNNCDYTRFTKMNGASRSHTYKPIYGDDEPFDPTPLLAFKQVIIWGYHHMAQRLPVGSVLVWDKKPLDHGGVLSDAELAWKKGGCGVYVFRHIWDGANRQTERGEHYHPTQKPIALMKWCIERVSKPGDTILDPYMGSGSTGVAAIELGRNFIGIEREPEYVEIARRRIEAVAAQERLPV